VPLLNLIGDHFILMDEFWYFSDQGYPEGGFITQFASWPFLRGHLYYSLAFIGSFLNFWGGIKGSKFKGARRHFLGEPHHRHWGRWAPL